MWTVPNVQGKLVYSEELVNEIANHSEVSNKGGCIKMKGTNRIADHVTVSNQPVGLWSR